MVHHESHELFVIHDLFSQWNWFHIVNQHDVALIVRIFTLESEHSVSNAKSVDVSCVECGSGSICLFCPEVSLEIDFSEGLLVLNQ